MIANVVDEQCRPEDAGRLAIGLRVEVTLVDLGDGSGLPQFRLSSEPPEHEPWRISARRASGEGRP
jgi:uncharacterized protein